VIPFHPALGSPVPALRRILRRLRLSGRLRLRPLPAPHWGPSRLRPLHRAPSPTPNPTAIINSIMAHKRSHTLSSSALPRSALAAPKSWPATALPLAATRWPYETAPAAHTRHRRGASPWPTKSAPAAPSAHSAWMSYSGLPTAATCFTPPPAKASPTAPPPPAVPPGIARSCASMSAPAARSTCPPAAPSRPTAKSLVYLQWDGACPAYQQSRLLRLDLSAPAPVLLLESADPIFH